MTRPSRRALSVLAKRRLGPELDELARLGVPSHVITPGERGEELFRGFPRRNPERADDIVELASVQTQAALHDGLGDLLSTH